jgi:hypothetical protein
MPESFSAFCSIVSLTAAKTRRMFEVSVACVRLGWSVEIRSVTAVRLTEGIG